MAAINKIATNSPSRQNPSELETAIAGALFDLESNTQDLKASLRPLQFVSAREVRNTARARRHTNWILLERRLRNFEEVGCSGVNLLDLWIGPNAYCPTSKHVPTWRKTISGGEMLQNNHISQSSTPFQSNSSSVHGASFQLDML